MTGFVPVMWGIWGVCIVLLAAVSLYSSRLGRDEEDQIFLSEGFSEEQSAQAAIAEKVNKIAALQAAGRVDGGRNDAVRGWLLYLRYHQAVSVDRNLKGQMIREPRRQGIAAGRREANACRARA